MTPEEQKEHNEHLERTYKARGEEYLASRNLEGEIENIASEKDTSKEIASEEIKDLLSKHKNVYKESEERNRIGDFVKGYEDLDEIIKKTNDAPWHKRAIDYIRAVYTPGGCAEVRRKNIEKRVKKQIRKMEKFRDKLKEQYNTLRDRLKQLQEKGEKLSNGYESASLSEIEKKEVSCNLQYVEAEHSICEDQMALYEKTFDQINSSLSELKRAQTRFKYLSYQTKLGLENI